MAKRGGYRSDKRKKETDRLKKQEEKRQRRFNKGPESDQPSEIEEGEGAPGEQEETEEGEGEKEEAGE